MDGVKEVDISLDQQKVRVVTDDRLSAEDVESAVAKTGKATEFWS